MILTTKATEKLFALIQELIDNKFYGEVEIMFRAGEVRLIKKTESIKLDRE